LFLFWYSRFRDERIQFVWLSFSTNHSIRVLSLLQCLEATAGETKASGQGHQCDNVGSGGSRSCGFEACLRHVCLCVSLRPPISPNAAGLSPSRWDETRLSVAD
jgi:hypothetical protein